jgi:hypothetical protein
MTDRELLQQSLDLLEDINQCSLPPTGIPLPAEIDHVMEALRAALAQPEHEPVFWYRTCADGMYEGPVHNNSVGGKMLRDEKPNEWQPLYTAPPQREWMEQERAVGYREGHQAALKQREWQGLTDEERKDIFKSCGVGDRGYVAAMVEAKLKEKNND